MDIKTLELMIIANDCKTILDIYSNSRDSLMYLLIFPFQALFCDSIYDYFKDIIEEYCQQDENSEYVTINGKVKEVHQMRNRLKLFSQKERYSRDKKTIIQMDSLQDKEFKNMLKYDFLKKLNLYYNLSIYFDNEYHIIGNTYLISETMNLYTFDDRKNDVFKLGEYFGQILASVYSSLNYLISEKNQQLQYELEYKTMDINTNNNPSIFQNGYSKELNLQLLYILSQVGVVNHVFAKILPKENLWLFRIKYITAHTSLYALSNIYEKCGEHLFSDNAKFAEIVNIINNKYNFLNSSFRNCMMHYKLTYDNNIIIKKELFDNKKPLFGLVESCYDGMSFNELNFKIESILNIIDESLSKLFYIDKQRVIDS